MFVILITYLVHGTLRIQHHAYRVVVTPLISFIIFI